MFCSLERLTRLELRARFVMRERGTERMHFIRKRQVSTSRSRTAALTAAGVMDCSGWVVRQLEAIEVIAEAAETLQVVVIGVFLFLLLLGSGGHVAVWDCTVHE
jgi:hypothetical protein